MLAVVNLMARDRAARRIVTISLGVLLVSTAVVGDAIAAVDCNPAPVRHHSAVKHRSHRRRAGVGPPAKKRMAVAAKRPAAHECPSLAATLADVSSLGTPADADPFAPVTDPVPEPDGSQAGAPRGGGQIAALAFPLSGAGGGAGGASGPDGGTPTGGSQGGGSGGGGPPEGGGPGAASPGGGGPGGGGPGGGEPYAAPPGGGGVSGVPEPGTWTMMMIGVGATGALVRRRRGAPQIGA